jgi:hypothetical protein
MGTTAYGHQIGGHETRGQPAALANHHADRPPRSVAHPVTDAGKLVKGPGQRRIIFSLRAGTGHQMIGQPSLDRISDMDAQGNTAASRKKA